MCSPEGGKKMEKKRNKTRNQKTIALTTRDMEVPEFVQDYRYLTTSQIQILLYPSIQKTQTRMLKIYKSGLVKRFPYPVLIRDGGKGEYVYHLGKLPRLYFSKLVHTIKLNDVRIAFVKGCQNSGIIRLLEFIPEYKKMSIRPSKNENKGYDGNGEEEEAESRLTTKKHIIPDGVMCLENPSLGKKALFFIEVDLGTEKITTTKKDQYSLLKKMLVYREWLQNPKYEEYSEYFGYEFTGFRVLVIMNAETRIQKLRKELYQNNMRKFIYMTEQGAIRSKTILKAIWQRPGTEDKRCYSIIE